MNKNVNNKRKRIFSHQLRKIYIVSFYECYIYWQYWDFMKNINNLPQFSFDKFTLWQSFFDYSHVEWLHIELIKKSHNGIRYETKGYDT